MSDHPVLTGETPELVAYSLLTGIAIAEGKQVIGGCVVAEKEWLLATYAECLEAAKGDSDVWDVDASG